MTSKIKNRIILFSIAIILGILQPLSAQEVVDRIVAIVNEDIITQIDVQEESTAYIKRVNMLKVPQERKEALIKKVKNDILEQLIEQTLTAQEANKYGIEISDDEVDQAIEHIKESRSLDQDNFQKALALEGLSLEEFREKLKSDILQSRIINFAVKSKIVVTQSDIKKYYDEHAEEYAGLKKYYLKNILIKERDKIESVLQQLKLNPSFEEMAKQYSEGVNAEDGGDLGLFDISDFSEPIKNRLSSLNPGEFTEIIETEQGFQIFLVKEIVVEGKKEYDQVAKEIEAKLYHELEQKQFKIWLETLKKNAHIKRIL